MAPKRTNPQAGWNSMIFELSQRFYFEAAHTLRREREPEPSRRVHGHTYLCEVSITGVPDSRTGMVVDLAELRACVESIRKDLDHRLLDEVPELGAATLENLCRFIWQRLGDPRWQISGVVVRRHASGDACRLRGVPSLERVVPDWARLEESEPR
jgi:6-pyruvoyltetrahydropterin/6-carboxytetrahydropterin synthase